MYTRILHVMALLIFPIFYIVFTKIIFIITFWGGFKKLLYA